MKKIIILVVFVMVFSLSSCVEELNTYEVTYHIDGGSMTVIGEDAAVNEVRHGTSIPEPTISKDGYTLAGWYSDSSMNVLFDFSQAVYGDLSLYAKWEAEEVIVDFYQVIADVMAALEESGDRPGYTIEGWYLDENLTMGIDITDYLDSDPEVYAKWVLEEYTVTYNVTDTISYTETYNMGDIVVLPTMYDLEGYELEGVYFDPMYYFEADTLFEMPNMNLEFYLNMEVESSELVVVFVPSRPADEILEMTAPLADMLQEELAELGMGNHEVEVLVSSSYEAAGEMLLAGQAHIAFMPAPTYVEYDAYDDEEHIEIILAATRTWLTKTSLNPMDWNDGVATEQDSTTQSPYYLGLIIAGPSIAGQQVAGIINSGGTLTWDDVKDLNWCVRSTTSSSGYVYPSIWLDDNFAKTFDDVTGSVNTTSGYGESMASLAAGTCDVGTFYSDARMHYVDRWTNDYGRTDTIWNEANIIGVTQPIMNDGIVVNTHELGEEMVTALQQAFINLISTEAGQSVFDIYSHEGYMIIDDEDYDSARAALPYYN